MCWEGGAVNSKQGGDDIHKGTAWWLSQGPWGGKTRGRGSQFSPCMNTCLSFVAAPPLSPPPPPSSAASSHHHPSSASHCQADFSPPGCVSVTRAWRMPWEEDGRLTSGGAGLWPSIHAIWSWFLESSYTRTTGFALVLYSSLKFTK